MARVIFNGEPGSEWLNETGKVQYQFLVSWRNSCGQCIQYDHAIGPYWGIPLHRGCRCRQKAIPPGTRAQPFVDFTAKIDGLDPHQQAVVVGRSNLLLIQKKIVKWEDVVTSTRIRDLREVVALQKLSVPQMVAAGVRKDLAEKAFLTVNTPAHELADQKRKELIAKLQNAGLTPEQIKQAVGERLARRVTIGTGPSGGMGFAGKPATPKPPPSPPPAAPPVAPKPPAPAKPAPIGVKPSRSLEVRIEGEPAAKARRTLDRIDQVHGVGDNPPLSVPLDNRNAPHSNGTMYTDTRRRPSRIAMSDDAYHYELTLTHEFGHYLEYGAIPLPRDRRPSEGRDWATDPLLKGFHEAAMASKAVQRLQALPSDPRVQAMDPEVRRLTGIDMANYHLKGEEIWARAYAQHIATETGDPEMLKQIGRRNEGTMPTQWTAEDFAPIARTIRQLFFKLGWATR